MTEIICHKEKCPANQKCRCTMKIVMMIEDKNTIAECKTSDKLIIEFHKQKRELSRDIDEKAIEMAINVVNDKLEEK